MPDYFALSVAVSCATPTDGGGRLAITGSYTSGNPPTVDNGSDTLLLVDDSGSVVDAAALPRQAPSSSCRLAGVPDGRYTLEWRNDTSRSAELLASQPVTVACAPTSGGGGATLVLDSSRHTDETAARRDGTATIQASGGTAPLTASLVETGASQAATAGQPATFTGLSPGQATLRVRDSSSPAQQVEAKVTIGAYVPPVGPSCADEYADNNGQAGACTYTPRWRSAWGPAGMSVRVAAVAGQVEAFVSAKLRVGFRPGHPLAADRPLVDVAMLRATVGPDGYATFVLAPYVRPLLGAPDGAGGYRLDLNSARAYDADLYVGYELRQTGGKLLEHGYAVNAAVPDAAFAGLVDEPLSPFAGGLPVWPGFDDYLVAYRIQNGRYGTLSPLLAADSDVANLPLPCPPNPLPVAWLAPGGGFGYWVFQGKPLLSDTVAQGQQYQEAATGELRYSERGASRRSYTASSGPFRGAALAQGLATLARSPQVWVQPVAGGPWVAVTLEAGTFPVQRWGVSRNELTGVVFTAALPHYVQGQ